MVDPLVNVLLPFEEVTTILFADNIILKRRLVILIALSLTLISDDD